MIRTFPIFATAAALAIGAGVAVAQAQVGSDPLPAGAARDTFVKVCSACHAPEIVLDKRLDYAGWDDVVQTMIGRGADATPEEAKTITKYLADNLKP